MENRSADAPVASMRVGGVVRGEASLVRIQKWSDGCLAADFIFRGSSCCKLLVGWVPACVIVCAWGDKPGTKLSGRHGVCVCVCVRGKSDKSLYPASTTLLLLLLLLLPF